MLEVNPIYIPEKIGTENVTYKFLKKDNYYRHVDRKEYWERDVNNDKFKDVKTFKTPFVVGAAALKAYENNNLVGL